MGVMQDLRPAADSGQLVITPHPVTLEGQRLVTCDLREGETLGAFLDRHVDLDSDVWEVKIGGAVIPCEHWHLVKPKHGHLIEVRGAVNEEALYIIAMLVLAYFTMGIGTAVAGTTAGAALGLTGTALMVANAAIFVVGSMLINKVLGPKQESAGSQARESVYSISGARNSIRPYEPLGLLFGAVRIAPDVLSQPYAWYEGNDQYVGMVLTPGINVDRFGPLYIGDTLLADYEGVDVWTSGFPGMPQQNIPLYSNADTIAGGELSTDGTWVTRVTSPDTVRIQVNLEYILGGVGTSGKKYTVHETVQVFYRPAGDTGAPWSLLMQRRYFGNTFDQKRATIAMNVDRGQYEVRVRILGEGAYVGANSHEDRFNFSTMSSIQADDADYRGIPEIGIKIKATGQLSGTPDQIRGVFVAKSHPMWTGTAWTTATTRATGLSNPGAQILAYARGFPDEDGVLIGGMGLPDGMIDIASLQGFMLHCQANGYAYDHWLQSARSHAEVLDTIALAGFGQISWAGGRLSVVWAADEQPLTGVVNMATMKKGAFQVDYTLANAADGVEYTYFDREDWSTKTLRVAAPGVTTMLNPAKLSGEGVTTEAHAAELARYHLAQSLYQYKDISYSTDLEHMTYKRLSVLALQHDMTKWGRGGRVQAATIDAGDMVTLTLDEPVPAPTSGNAFMGLRIPGESVYRVFQVAPFTGETRTIALAEPWPADAALPGEGEGNPAHDTIWIYDFKSTPGYRVRVVSIEPESGLKGARIAVVPESPQFWDYVKTGAYIPPVNPPQYPTRPLASNLTISENQVVQGSSEFTELTATFDVDGHVSHCVVFAGLTDAPLQEVAQTSTRTATWRIDDPGEYAIVVRPYDVEGNVGGAVSTVYVTINADTPPALFDVFDVIALSGGVRKYQWSYLETTMQPANLAGAEIRYLPGNVTSPVWESMTILGEEGGYFTSAFEMVMPASGTWTFAIRSRNTAGILSTAMLRIVKVLAENLGEVIEDWDASTLVLTQQLAQEIIDRAAGDDAEALARSAQVTQLSAVLDFQSARTWNFVSDLNGFTVVNATQTFFPPGNNFGATAITSTTNDPNYNSPAFALPGKQAATVRALIRRRTNSTWQGRLYWATTAHGAGEGFALNAPAPAVGEWAVVEWDLAGNTDWITSTITGLRFDFAGASGAIVDVRWIAIGVKGGVPASGYAAKALETRITEVDGNLTSTAADVTLLRSEVQGALIPGRNLLSNPTGAQGTAGWTMTTTVPASLLTAGMEGAQPILSVSNGTVSGNRFVYRDFVHPDLAGKAVTFSIDMFTAGLSGAFNIDMVGLDRDGLPIWFPGVVVSIPSHNTWHRLTTTLTLPANVFGVRARSRAVGATFNAFRLRNAKLEIGAAATAYSDDVPYSSATTLLQTQATLLANGQSVLMASYSLSLDVNGYVTGWKFNNDGTTGDLTIVADKFRIVTPGSSPVTPFALTANNLYLNANLNMGSSRYIVNRRGTFMTVMGNGFGSSNQFLEWTGPNLADLSLCTEANAVSYLTVNGDAYFGGSLSAGVLKNAATSTQVSGTASVETGIFSTNGTSKVVVGSLAYGTSGTMATLPWTGSATQAISATLTIQRSYNGGAWTNVTSGPVTGTRTYSLESGQYLVNIQLSGSRTSTDNTAGTGTFNYRAVLSAASGWPFTINGTGVTESQRLTIVSTEG